MGTPRARIILCVPGDWGAERLAGLLREHGPRDVVPVEDVRTMGWEHARDPATLLVLGVARGMDAVAAVEALPHTVGAPLLLVLHAPEDVDTPRRLRQLGVHATLPFAAGSDLALERTVHNLLETSTLRSRLAQSEAQYTELLQNTRDAIYILGPTQFTFVNTAFTELMGYTADEICNPAFDYMRLIAPESRPMIMERARLAALGEPLPPRYEFISLNKAGQRLDVGVSVSYIVYDGQPSSLGVLQDITARKQYEKALLRRNRELAVLNDLAATVSRAPDLGTVLDTAVERLIAVMGFNAAGISLVQPGHNVARARLFRGVGPEQLEKLQELSLETGLVGAAIRTGDVQVVTDLATDERVTPRDAFAGFHTAVCVPIQAKDRVLGTAVGLCLEPREFAPEELSLLLSIGHQLGTAVERAALHDHQDAAMQRLLALDELARALSSTLDRDEVFRVAGQQLMRVLRATTVEVLVLRTVSGLEPVLEVVLRGRGAEWMPTGTLLPEGRGLQWRVLGADGPVVLDPGTDQSGHWGADEVRWVTGAPMIVDGRAAGAVLVGFSFDRQQAEAAREFLGSVSAHLALASRNAAMFGELVVAYKDLREAKDRLVLQEKLSALGEMAAGVAHDFNNVLGAILGRTQLLKTFVADSNLQKNLDVIERAALDGAATVRRIQEFSRVGGEEDFHDVDLDEVAAQAAELTQPRWKDRATREGVAMEVQVHVGHAPHVLGDAQQLREVLTNLIHNACDAMPRGGTILVSTGTGERGAFLRVADTGTGIPPEVQSRVFDPFFTTKGVKGTGLGLSVSYGIVQRHRGEFQLDSEPGRGATFTIWLPIPAEPAAAPPPPRPNATAGGARVLIIDDEESIRDVLADMLRTADHHVETAVDGPSALARLDALVAEGLDAVFTDLGMPGMSGWEVASAVKERHPGLPVGLITGWGATLEPARMKDHGVDLVVPKPFRFEQVTALVEEALALRRARA
ncbi:MAG: PAS domain S-box protein [Deltaproteobacteria bacterium]|nr:PAS domain S-box protein [Deltaproteobacteria bacterium]